MENQSLDASQGRSAESAATVAAHTPGPWLIMGRTVYALHGGANRFDAYVQGHGAPADEIAANARLIAAAPELLAALRAVLPMAEVWMRNFNTAPVKDWTNIEMALDAIAKAEGR